MKTKILSLLFLLATAQSALASQAFMPQGKDELIPWGAADLCKREPDPVLCGPAGDTVRVHMDDEHKNQMNEVQNQVNIHVVFKTDQELYGKIEFWTVADKYGDCEDYVLLKRKMLIEKGWPAASLDVAIGVAGNGEPHAILIVHGDNVDYVLDNLTRTPARNWIVGDYQWFKISVGGSIMHWRAIDVK